MNTSSILKKIAKGNKEEKAIGLFRLNTKDKNGMPIGTTWVGNPAMIVRMSTSSTFKDDEVGYYPVEGSKFATSPTDETAQMPKLSHFTYDKTPIVDVKTLDKKRLKQISATKANLSKAKEESVQLITKDNKLIVHIPKLIEDEVVKQEEVNFDLALFEQDIPNVSAYFTPKWLRTALDLTQTVQADKKFKMSKVRASLDTEVPIIEFWLSDGTTNIYATLAGVVINEQNI